MYLSSDVICPGGKGIRGHNLGPAQDEKFHMKLGTQRGTPSMKEWTNNQPTPVPKNARRTACLGPWGWGKGEMELPLRICN